MPAGRSVVRFAVGLLVVLALGGCTARREITGEPTPRVDRKLSRFAFIEEGDLVTLIVDTRATFYREKSPYIPLEVAIANNGLRQLVLTRESFTLIDEAGNRYPVVAPRELIENYDFLDLDRRQLAELEGIVFNKFAAYARYPSQFSPTRDVRVSGSSLVRDLVSLPKFGYLIDFLYFPQPQTGLKDHRFELRLQSESLDEPVFVKFFVE